MGIRGNNLKVIMLLWFTSSHGGNSCIDGTRAWVEHLNNVQSRYLKAGVCWVDTKFNRCLLSNRDALVAVGIPNFCSIPRKANTQHSQKRNTPSASRIHSTRNSLQQKRLFLAWVKKQVVPAIRQYLFICASFKISNVRCFLYSIAENFLPLLLVVESLTDLGAASSSPISRWFIYIYELAIGINTQYSINKPCYWNGVSRTYFIMSSALVYAVINWPCLLKIF